MYWVLFLKLLFLMAAPPTVLTEPRDSGTGTVEADGVVAVVHQVERVAQDLTAADGTGQAGAAGDVNAGAIGEDVVEDMVALDHRTSGGKVINVNRPAATRDIRGAVAEGEIVGDDLDGLVVAARVGADLDASNGGIGGFDENPVGTEVVGGVGVDGRQRRRRIGDRHVGGSDAHEGDARLRRAEEEAELVGPGNARWRASRGGLVIDSREDADLAACAHLVDCRLDGQLRRRGRIAIIRIVTGRAGVAHGRAWRDRRRGRDGADGRDRRGHGKENEFPHPIAPDLLSRGRGT